MAAQAADDSSLCKLCLCVAGGVAVTGALYAIYRHRQSRNIVDEESPERKVLVLGLDGAGKSSILMALSKSENRLEPRPTEGFNVICIHTMGNALNVWEIGGSEKMRSYWHHFTKETDALLYVVDAADEDRLPLALQQLQLIVQDAGLQGKPVFVAANKQDLPGAKGIYDIFNTLDLDESQRKKLCIVGTQAAPGKSYEGLLELEEMFQHL